MTLLLNSTVTVIQWNTENAFICAGNKDLKPVYHLGARFQWWTSSLEAVVDNHKERLGMPWKTLLHCNIKNITRTNETLETNFSTKDVWSKYFLTYKRVSCGPMITTSHLYMSSSSIRPAEKPSTGFLLSSGKREVYSVLMQWTGN